MAVPLDAGRQAAFFGGSDGQELNPDESELQLPAADEEVPVAPDATGVTGLDVDLDADDPTSFAVLVGNLRGDVMVTQLKNDIIRILQSIGLRVCENSVHIVDHIVTRDAFVYVASEFDQRRVVDAFHDTEDLATASRDRVATASVLLSAPGRPLVVSLITPKPVAEVLREQKKRHQMCPRDPGTTYYVRGARLGNENRSLEFKIGQGNVEQHLAECVNKYVTAFLNGEGGTLMLGVNDRGEVLGVPQCDHPREDKLRLRIDAVIRGIVPPVFPSSYTVRFVPVKKPDCEEFIPNCKVIEICTEPGSSDNLYQSQSGDVFIRRDGSVQGPLKAAEIQEWTRMNMTRQHRMEDELMAMRERERQLVEELEIRRMQDNLTQRQLYKLATDERELKRITRLQMQEVTRLADLLQARNIPTTTTSNPPPTSTSAPPPKPPPPAAPAPLPIAARPRSSIPTSAAVERPKPEVTADLTQGYIQRQSEGVGGGTSSDPDRLETPPANTARHSFSGPSQPNPRVDDTVPLKPQSPERPGPIVVPATDPGSAAMADDEEKGPVVKFGAARTSEPKPNELFPLSLQEEDVRSEHSFVIDYKPMTAAAPVGVQPGKHHRRRSGDRSDGQASPIRNPDDGANQPHTAGDDKHASKKRQHDGDSRAASRQRAESAASRDAAGAAGAKPQQRPSNAAPTKNKNSSICVVM